ncbi:Uncharacterised protein [Enterobacter hormaechei]|nr:Uncharacterised protein [Enterobacter hormaechei]CZV01287.1 Uncharacterised protein [Enterobacter hormaechei]CZW73708.1 Uncharacterised protein [Enterobacter hormaechei]CZX20625.1 Uncharacterised protein [Enterobacter hormaechei]CZX29596.1 Uncharacterised protein [Enterobacter hormaechei]
MTLSASGVYGVEVKADSRSIHQVKIARDAIQGKQVSSRRLIYMEKTAGNESSACLTGATPEYCPECTGCRFIIFSVFSHI